MVDNYDTTQYDISLRGGDVKFFEIFTLFEGRVRMFPLRNRTSGRKRGCHGGGVEVAIRNSGWRGGATCVCDLATSTYLSCAVLAYVNLRPSNYPTKQAGQEKILHKRWIRKR